MRLRDVPRHLLALRNGHQVVATARRLGASQGQARMLGKSVQVVRSPRELHRRRRLAWRLLEEVTPPFSLVDAYVRFHVGDLPHGTDALRICREVAAEEKAGYRPGPHEKGFLRSLLSPARLQRHPELVRFGTSDEITAVLAAYLGTVPTLSDIRLWWSVPGEGLPPKSSQLFHRDHEDFRQVKVFVNVEDVDAESGPFTFLPAHRSEAIARQLRQAEGRQADQEILAFVDDADLVVLTGAVGEAAMVDTCRCFHFGSRNERKERLLLMLHYVGYHSIVEPDVKVLTDEVRSSWRGSPVAAALLRTRGSGL